MVYIQYNKKSNFNKKIKIKRKKKKKSNLQNLQRGINKTQNNNVKVKSRV